MRRLGKVVGVGLLGIVVTGMTVWGMGALYYSALPVLLRGVLAVTFGLATVGAFLLLPHRPSHAPGLRARMGRPGPLVEHHHPLQRARLAA
jgi:hypothetical protein